MKKLHSNHTNIRVVEIDEMCSYIGSKKTTVGFELLLIRYEKRFISFIIGCKGIKTGKKLWNTIKDKKSIDMIATDDWRSYHFTFA